MQMEAQRQQLFAQWEAKLSQAQEATEAANAAHTADKEAVESAASQALAAAAGETAGHTCQTLALPCFDFLILHRCGPYSCRGAGVSWHEHVGVTEPLIGAQTAHSYK